VEAAQWERLVTVMERLATGDRAAVVTLYVEFGRVLSGVVRRHLGRLGVHGVVREELDGLVLDACFALEACAPAWQPETGVAPWTWAERRVAGVVSAWVGQHSDGLDDTVLDVPAPVPAAAGELAPLELLGTRDEPMCRLLRDAFVAAGVSTRDQQLLVETRLQASLGDPAPAVTIAPLYGMQPAAVRQAVKRTKDRLRQLSLAQPGFAPLAELRLLA
jgi:hypothetical protein